MLGARSGKELIKLITRAADSDGDFGDSFAARRLAARAEEPRGVDEARCRQRLRCCLARRRHLEGGIQTHMARGRSTKSSR